MSLQEMLVDERYWGRPPFPAQPRLSRLACLLDDMTYAYPSMSRVHKECRLQGVTATYVPNGDNLPIMERDTILRVVFDKRTFLAGRRGDLFLMPSRATRLQPPEFVEQAREMWSNLLYTGDAISTEFFGANAGDQGKYKIQREVTYYESINPETLRGLGSWQISRSILGVSNHFARNEMVVGQTYQLPDHTIGRIAAAHLLVPEA